jgi:hypothetical protein
LIVMLAVYYTNQERSRDTSQPVLRLDTPPSAEITSDLDLPQEESPPTQITSDPEASGRPEDQFRDSSTVVTRPAEGLPPGFGAEDREKAMQRLYETVTKAKENPDALAEERQFAPSTAEPADESQTVEDKPPGVPPAPRLGPRS